MTKLRLLTRVGHLPLPLPHDAIVRRESWDWVLVTEDTDYALVLVNGGHADLIEARPLVAERRATI